jgi:hypothetical protein
MKWTVAPSSASREPHLQGATLSDFELPTFTSAVNAEISPAISAQQQPHHTASKHGQSPPIGRDSTSERHPPTPTYNYQPTGTPQQTDFPYSTSSQQSSVPYNITFPPISTRSALPQMSPAISHGSIPSIPSNSLHSLSSSLHQRPPPSSYQPGPAPVFSNDQNPNGQLSLVGVHPGMMPGFNSGHAAAIPHFLGHPQRSSTNDRPFKCDQCPLSYNRNHDLKRHKRIHLAVKPFPCKHCDKSFSRKDALKVSSCLDIRKRLLLMLRSAISSSRGAERLHFLRQNGQQT